MANPDAVCHAMCGLGQAVDLCRGISVDGGVSLVGVSGVQNGHWRPKRLRLVLGVNFVVDGAGGVLIGFDSAGAGANWLDIKTFSVLSSGPAIWHLVRTCKC